MQGDFTPFTPLRHPYNEPHPSEPHSTSQYVDEIPGEVLQAFTRRTSIAFSNRPEVSRYQYLVPRWLWAPVEGSVIPPSSRGRRVSIPLSIRSDLQKRVVIEKLFRRPQPRHRQPSASISRFVSRHSRPSERLAFPGRRARASHQRIGLRSDIVRLSSKAGANHAPRACPSTPQSLRVSDRPFTQATSAAADVYDRPICIFFHKSHGLSAVFFEGSNTFRPEPADS
jgi:hypothetical protein